MKRKVIAIFMATIVCGLSLAFPMQVHAEDVVIESGTERDVEESETITINRGTVDNNDGEIVENYGKVEKNSGIIDSNSATVVDNWGTVKTNNGAVNNNNSLVENNKNSIGSNGVKGKVTTNSGTINTNNGLVETNTKTVKNNNGTVKSNDASGTIGTNSATVESNSGTVTTNNGTIIGNTESGKIITNNATLQNNNGIVENNYSDITNNAGKITNNYGGTVMGGVVENNYGGTVSGGTTQNQWYEYIINGGKYVSASNSKDVEGKNWIGKAESAHETLGSYYITVTANNGMIFDRAVFEGGETATGILNEDGSYTFGNISKSISVFFKQIISNKDNGGSSNNTNDDTKTESGETIGACEEAISITNFTSNAALAKMPADAKKLGATYNLSGITSIKGFATAISKICEAVSMQNAGNRKVTSVTIYSDRPMNYTAEILKTIEASGIDFIFVFMHNGKMYKVTIPSGAVIDFSGHVCEGPLYLGRILGTTEEIR